MRARLKVQALSVGAWAENAGSAAEARDAQPEAMPTTRVVAVPEHRTLPQRRRVLGHWLGLAMAGLTGAPDTVLAARLPDVPAGPGSSSARTRLLESALAHGLAAWRQHHDLNATFSSAWSPASGWLADEAGDAAATAKAAHLRLLPAAGLLAVRHGQPGSGPWLLRRQAQFGHAESADTPGPAAAGALAGDPQAALMADALGLLLLGPVAVFNRATAVNWGPPDTLDGRRCDQLVLTVAPGLGLAPESHMALFVDRDVGWLRRLRWSGEAPGAGWRGLAELDFFDHFSLQGMVWPRRFQLPARWWLPGASPQTAWLTGLDLDRGYGTEALAGDHWTGDAAAPARPLPAP